MQIDLRTELSRAPIPQDQPIKGGRATHVKVLADGLPEVDMNNTLAADVDVCAAVGVGNDGKHLEHRATLDHVIYAFTVKGDVVESKVSEVGEDVWSAREIGHGGARKRPEAEVEAACIGAAKDVDGEAQVRVSGETSPFREVDEDEVFDALLGEEAGPLALLQIGVHPHRPAGEVDGAEGPAVLP